MSEWKKVERLGFAENLRKASEAFREISEELILRDVKRLKAMAEHVVKREMDKAGNG